MNPSQRDLRRAAAQAFMRSLDQLEMRMSGSETPACEDSPLEPATPPAPSQPPTDSQRQITVQEWEAAVTEIEHLLGKSSESKRSKSAD